MTLSTPELYWFAGLLLARIAPGALAASFGFWLARWRRVSGVCLLVALLAVVLGAVALLNPFCIGGYTAPDGTCAEE